MSSPVAVRAIRLAIKATIRGDRPAAATMARTTASKEIVMMIIKITIIIVMITIIIIIITMRVLLRKESRKEGLKSLKT